jgi:hypothetical protein
MLQFNLSRSKFRSWYTPRPNLHWSVCVRMRARIYQNCNNFSMWSSCLHARLAKLTQCVNATSESVNFDWVTYAIKIRQVICILIKRVIKHVIYNWQRAHIVSHNTKICCMHPYKFLEHPFPVPSLRFYSQCSGSGCHGVRQKYRQTLQLPFSGKKSLD